MKKHADYAGLGAVKHCLGLGIADHARHGSISLNLFNQIDAVSELPTVAFENDISKAWAIEYGEYPADGFGGNAFQRDRFRKSDLLSNHIEIAPSAALRGPARQEALTKVQQLLSERFPQVPTALQLIFKIRQTAQRDSLDYLSTWKGTSKTLAYERKIQDRFFSIPEITEIKKGLCDCGHPAFQDEIEKVRLQLTDPKFPVRVWDENLKQARPIFPSDLGCTMS